MDHISEICWKFWSSVMLCLLLHLCHHGSLWVENQFNKINGDFILNLQTCRQLQKFQMVVFNLYFQRICGVFVFLLCSQNHFLASAGFFRLTVLPRQMFPHCLTGKLCLAGVTEVPRQVECLTWAEENTGKTQEMSAKKIKYKTEHLMSIW